MLSITLPACAGAAGFWSVAAASGCAGLTAQVGLQKLFKRSDDPVLSRSPGYTAHSVVATTFCIFASVFGVIGWTSALQLPAAATATGRVLSPNDSARWLCAFAFGIIGFWDTPTCLAIKGLRKPAWGVKATPTARFADDLTRRHPLPRGVDFVHFIREAAVVGKLSGAAQVAMDVHATVPDLGGGPIGGKPYEHALHRMSATYRRAAFRHADHVRALHSVPVNGLSPSPTGRRSDSP